MILGQASAVEPLYLHQTWIFWMAIFAALGSPVATIWVAARKQKREVTQGEEFVTKPVCAMATKHIEDRIAAVDARQADLRARVDRIESEVANMFQALRADIQLLVRAVGQLEGKLSQVEARMGSIETRFGRLEGKIHGAE